MAAVEESKNSEALKTETKLPEWLKPALFEDVLKDTVCGFRSIQDFKASGAMTAGENYSSVMLRVKIEVELETDETKTLFYMLKVSHDSEMMTELTQKHNIFHLETGMYSEVLPELEEMYRAAGVEVRFGPRSYKLPTTENYVLLEDLCPAGFKNADRLTGMDMQHVKCVLHKLAMLHAASATRIANKGRYAHIYEHSYFTEVHRPIIKDMYDGMQKPVLENFKRFHGHEAYLQKVEKLHPVIVEELFRTMQVDENQFNVLNHGDCWTNNIMFQYDANGNVKETFLVDHQIPKYDTPALDLTYFLFSSAAADIKLKHFDYFVKYYHDHLVEYLQLLKYPKELPTLKDIHIALLKFGAYGYSTAVFVMAVALLPPTNMANFDNLFINTPAGDDFRMLMFSNDNYRQHAEPLLTWLNNRGALECSQKQQA